ncbi:unnamed protein product [Didymodactylos carnosus]|uniref:Mitochondrial carrier protein n=1 Tax=Didymodactylos carnosus TaxID=1234261 RepID=A0A813YI75_9BILA|nr:unnamed protein product [Didymodactylos carnosus]CAF1011645.1 unnamed protein product [Didymodactylos carnosus]CAF3670193.1 unnamed protein product [Didymodactylos carnosus]CAF3780569.1 unnamed protein product [Didymodactylos carnosus]
MYSEKAIKLVANDAFRQLLKTKSGTLPVHRQIVAGGLAGTCQIVVTTPMELLKIQMQMTKEKSKSSIPSGVTQSSTSPQAVNARQLALQLFKEKGIFGLYKGLGATFTRDVCFSMMYFPLFAYFNDKGKEPGSNQVPFYHSFLSGLGAGSLSAYLATPLDVIKTRLQTLEYKNRYSGILDCAGKMFRQEGASAFFKGSLLRVMVIAPLFGIAQMVYYLGIAETLLGLKPLGSQAEKMVESATLLAFDTETMPIFYHPTFQQNQQYNQRYPRGEDPLASTTVEKQVPLPPPPISYNGKPSLLQVALRGKRYNMKNVLLFDLQELFDQQNPYYRPTEVAVRVQRLITLIFSHSKASKLSHSLATDLAQLKCSYDDE